MKKLFIVVVAGAALGACSRNGDTGPEVQTAMVERRTIMVQVEATGVVEPINVVEVKSKASGMIEVMPVETGHQVRAGELLAQVETRDARNQFDQAQADVRAADARLAVAEAQRKRSDDLWGQRIITAQEHEASTLDYANAQAQLVRTRASLDLARQRLEDATVRAPVGGTVIEKLVSRGQVITSSTGAFGAGTTLLKMADLSQVRVRANVNETDIGQVQPGQQVRVVVDAYPDRPFTGTVEKVEPQAVVQQSVTMFPVLVSVNNAERLLMPGMNGEVSVMVEQRQDVVAVPNDAVRTMRDLQLASVALGLNPDSVRAQLQAQMGGGMRGPGGPGGAQGAPAAPPGGSVTSSSGDVVPTAQARFAQNDIQQQGRGQDVQATPEQCQQFNAALEKNPDARRRLDALRERMRSGDADMQQMRTESQAIYAQLGVDPRIARACGMQRGQAGATQQGQQGQQGQQRGGPDDAARQGRQGAQSREGQAAPNGNPAAIQLGQPGERMQGTRARTRPGVVFVAENGTFVPRSVRLGVANYDYSEVVSGLQEGEHVALLAAAAMQAQRQQNIDRMRERAGGVPGMQRQPTGGAAGGGAGGGAGRQGGGGGPPPR